MLRYPSPGPGTSLWGLPAPCPGWSPNSGIPSLLSLEYRPGRTLWPGCGAVCSKKGKCSAERLPSGDATPCRCCLGVFSVISFASLLLNAQQAWHRWQSPSSPPLCGLCHPTWLLHGQTHSTGHKLGAECPRQGCSSDCFCQPLFISLKHYSVPSQMQGEELAPCHRSLLATCTSPFAHP